MDTWAYGGSAKELAELESKFICDGIVKYSRLSERAKRSMAVEITIEAGDVFVGDDEYEGWNYV